MSKPLISIIAAIGSNRELGKDNKLLWQIPEDLKRFKELTLNHPVIMGRKTFQSIGRPLPGRTNIIITHEINYQVKECFVTHSLGEAIKLASNKPAVAKATEDKEIFIIGGGQIYEQAIGIADKLYLTLIDGTFDADTFFPDYSRFKKVVYKKEGKFHQYKYTFLELIPN